MTPGALRAALTPGRDEARRWAEEELSRQEYQEADLTLLQRLGEAISRFLSDLVAPVAEFESAWLFVVVVLVVAALAVLIVWRVRRGSGGSLSDPYRPLDLQVAGIDPAELRARADRAAAAKDWNRAVQERVRAVMAELDRAGLVEITTASTTAELTASAARARPDEAADLTWAGGAFDAVTFGDAVADAADHRRIADLDRRLLSGVRS